MATGTGVPDGAREITARDPEELRAWFATHHDAEPGVWLVYWKKGSGRASVTWDEAVDEALCAGWIDSKVQRVDDHRYRQWFSPRKPGSVWSQANKEKVERLRAEGRLLPSVGDAVDAAKADGSWHALDLSDALVVPDDLAAALDGDPARRRTYEAWPPGVRRAILEQVYGAKRAETRQRRVDRVVEATDRGERPFGL